MVIPGVAMVEVRTSAVTEGGPGVTAVKITPLPLTGEAAKHPPSGGRDETVGGGPGVLYRRGMDDGAGIVADTV